MDNATLTAVQRLMGHIPVKNRYDLDGDILALESLLQAILFFDEVYFLDDYKPEYREERAACFYGLRPLPVGEELGARLSREALRLTSDVVPRVSGGAFADGDFKGFFELLQMNMWYVWNMSSSVFYLTQKLLADAGDVDIGKYSALSSMIYSEFRDQTLRESIPEREPVLLDSQGRPITGSYSVAGYDAEVSRQASAFFAGLNWLAYRTVYYTLAAQQTGLDLFLHPIRQAFQVNFMKKSRPQDPSHFRPIVAALTETASATAARIYSLTSPAVLSDPQPLFSAWIASRGGPGCPNFLELCYHLRQEGEFVRAREQLDQLEGLFASNPLRFRRDANRLHRDLERQLQRIRERFKVDTPQGSPVTSMITLWDAAAPLTGLPPLEQANPAAAGLRLAERAHHYAGFASVYKSILTDLAQVQQLGSIRELITRQVQYTNDAQYFPLKTQDPAYIRAHSGWSQPM